jgi:hypothetical protein
VWIYLYVLNDVYFAIPFFNDYGAGCLVSRMEEVEAAPLKSTPSRSADPKLPSSKSGTSRGLCLRHEFHFATPCSNIDKCSGLAISKPLSPRQNGESFQLMTSLLAFVGWIVILPQQ